MKINLLPGDLAREMSMRVLIPYRILVRFFRLFCLFVIVVAKFAIFLIEFVDFFPENYLNWEICKHSLLNSYQ